MAKKTVKVDLKSAGAEPAAGDVNISYKGSRIAGLSESSTAVLETENTIVQDDIEIEYTKPASGNTLIPVTVNNSSSNPYVNIMREKGAAIKKVSDNLVNLPGGESDINDIEYIIPDFDDFSNSYRLGFSIRDIQHALDVTINNVPSEYSDTNHYLLINSETYPESVIINITDKATE